MGEMDQIVQEFLAESHEILDQLGLDLVALERASNRQQLLSAIFRGIHTIKGASGLLGFAQLESVTHVGESLLSSLRDEELFPDVAVTGALLELVDAVRSLLDSVERTGSDRTGDHAALIARLTALQQSARATSRPIGEVLVDTGRIGSDDIARALAVQETGDPRPLGEILVGMGLVHASDISAALRLQNGAPPLVADRMVRVDVQLLDSLAALVEELLRTRSELVERASTSGDPELLRATQQLSALTERLQEDVQNARQRPIGSVWNRFPRLVRDLSLTLGKQVKLQMEGAGTQVGRSVLDAITSPLTHLVRNAVDHGIERPHVRRAAGKHPEGVLTLRAASRGGELTLVVSDDGAGIDPEGVRCTAMGQGLGPRAVIEGLSDREVLGVIFHPGFSTAREITKVSGRGVGLDVVRTNIERIGGRVEVRSSIGCGTTVRITVPATGPQPLRRSGHSAVESAR